MKGLFEAVKSNAGYVAGFLGIIVMMFAVALLAERHLQKKSGRIGKIFTTRKIAMIGLFSALAAVIMVVLEIPMPFAPAAFYKLDFSELPILIGAFAFGPAAGVMMEFIKILLKLCIKGTTTAFIGDLANFMIGCSLILPASIIYERRKTKKNAIVGCIVGTLVMTVFGTAMNAIYLLPALSSLFGMPMEAILAKGAETNSLVSGESIVGFVVFCVAPLNLIKGVADSLLTILIYKPLSPIIKGRNS